jgi:hypothetical protein
MSGKFTHWNYRVLMRTRDEPTGEQSEWFEMIECYYDGAEITAWSPVTPGGDTVRDIAEDLYAMARAADMAVLRSADRRPLTLDDLPGDES